MSKKRLITDHLDPDFVPFACPLCGGEADCEEHLESSIDYGFFKSAEQAEMLAEQTELYRAKQKRESGMQRVCSSLRGNQDDG